MKEIIIQVNHLSLSGNLEVPETPVGLVVFAHGSGSSRFSPRNNAVAQSLNDSGLATLLFDLLTTEEDKIDQFTREYRFDIPLLADRLIVVTEWIKQQSQLKDLSLGYFGSSTGAAAALIAAAKLPTMINAVVSRGGRPDLAGSALAHVQAPTLLIVGGLDAVVIDLNKDAQTQMNCENRLDIVPGATHLFEEPGKLEQVMQLASNYFCEKL